MIELACATLREELRQFKERTRAGCPRGDCCTRLIELNGNMVACTAEWSESRGKLTVKCTWRLNGKRLGENALIGALKDKGLS